MLPLAFIYWTALKWLLILGIVGVIIWRCVKTTEDERLVRKLIITAVLLPIIAFSVLTGILGAILAPAF